MSKAITLEGEVLRMEWINPHILLFLQSKNDKGQSETWILHGSSLGTDDARTSSRIVGAGEIRFSNGDVVAIGGGPSF
jgi:hypothetical protein